jgi:hypothetical protein
MADSSFIANAGEHFVAYKIAMLGFIPSLIHQGIRGIDVLASSADGARSVGLQIKSAASAIYEKSGAAQHVAFHLRFPLGQRAISAIADSTLVCFVDLRKWSPREGPDVYIVSGKQLKCEYSGVCLRKYTPVHYERSLSTMEQYRNNWQPLVEALSAADPQETAERPTSLTEPFVLPAVAGGRF